MSRVPFRLDVALGFLGIAFGSSSVAYPFGRDQGLYYYVAREWVLRGSVPYRDVLDHKTPGIYVLYAIAVRLFGEGMWGIRVLDLLGVVVTGIVAAELSAERGERVRDGARGAAVLGTSILYYGYLDFWSTAQSELWYGMLAVGAVVAARRVRRESIAALAAGLLAGAALIMKPPAMPMVLVAFACLVHRAWRADEHRAKHLARSMALFAAGAAIVCGGVFGYLAAKGALDAMIDIVVRANAYYVEHERGTSGELYLYPWYYFPIVPALLLYLVTSLRKESKERFVVALAVTFAASAAVAMQGKFYLLHWAVAIPALAVVVANAFRALADWLEAKGRARVLPLAFVAIALALYLPSPAKLPVLDMRPAAMWSSGSLHAYRRAFGLESREELAAYFATPSGLFWFDRSERVGDWLRDHTTEDDYVCVRGFQPEIYAVARRRHSGRFFWTTFLTNPARAYRREEWLREDRDAFVKNPPKYVVALGFVREGPDAPSTFEALGYRTIEVQGDFTIMGRESRAERPTE